MQTVAWTLSSTARRLTAMPSAVAASVPTALRGLGGVLKAEKKRFQPGDDFDPQDLAQRITIEVLDESSEEAEVTLVTRAGHERARAAAWDSLARDVTQADRRCATTRGGVRHRALLQSGALLLIDTAIRVRDWTMARDALAEFEDAHTNAPDCPVRAALAARANIGLGWGIRGDGPAADVTADQWREVDVQVARAQQILAPFEGFESAILCEARYRVAVLGDGVQRTLPPLFETWTAIDPEDSAPMEMHGFYLLPRWGGSHENIELQARRAAIRTEHTMGFAGYAMLSLPLMEHEPELLLTLDPALFVEGVDDWMATYPEPSRVNAFLREVVDLTYAQYPGLEGRPELAAFKDYLAECLPRLIVRHLRVVDLSAWDDDPDCVRSVIALAYRDHFRAGGTLVLTAKGALLDPD